MQTLIIFLLAFYGHESLADSLLHTDMICGAEVVEVTHVPGANGYSLVLLTLRPLEIIQTGSREIPGGMIRVGGSDITAIHQLEIPDLVPQPDPVAVGDHRYFFLQMDDGHPSFYQLATPFRPMLPIGPSQRSELTAAAALLREWRGFQAEPIERDDVRQALNNADQFPLLNAR